MPHPDFAPGPPTEVVGRDDIRGVYAGASAAAGADTPPPAGPFDLPPLPLCPADRYRLVGELARGGMGVLFRAIDTLLGREVVVKLLREEFAGRRAVERRFLREARVNGQLQHPGVVPVYDAGRFPDARPFLTLKYVPGRTLEALLLARPDPARDRPPLLRVVADVAATLAYAHSRGVVHRDVKPGNVIVSRDGEVRVLDWGLAKVLPDTRAMGSQETEPDLDLAEPPHLGPGQTAHGAAVGTPAYMPPEQAAGDQPGVDERCDVFGLGGLLAAVLTGHPPYAAATAPGVWAQARAADLAAAHARVRGCGADPGLVDLAVRCLAAAPADRPRDAREVACALAAVLAAPAPPADGLARRAWAAGRSAVHFPVRLLQSIR